MSRHDDTVYLRHMPEHARTAVVLAEGKHRTSLETEPLLRYSLLHLVCILGEAANRVSDAGRARYSAIAWRNITGMRNMLIHGYDRVDLDILWATVIDDLPVTIRSLEEALSEADHP